MVTYKPFRRKIGMKETIITIAFYIYMIVSWVVNLIQFMNCDFEGPFKEEIIKGIGVIFFLPSGITVWF